MTFDPRVVASWPMVLTVEHVAAIYHMTPAQLTARIRRRSHGFTPAPYRRRPALWRKDAVVADALGEVAASALRVVKRGA